MALASGRQVMPKPLEAKTLFATNFKDSAMDRSHRLSWWGHTPTKLKALDFGCSLGYGVVQLQRAGFDAIGFEPSRPRAAGGRECFGVTIESDFQQLVADYRGQVGLIYTDHVLEHLNDLWSTFDGFAELLAPGGHLVAFVPNCGGRSARALGIKWGPFLGEPHTVAFTAQWLKDRLPAHGFEVETLGGVPGKVDLLPDGDELVCVARRLPNVNESSDFTSLSDRRDAH